MSAEPIIPDGAQAVTGSEPQAGGASAPAAGDTTAQAGLSPAELAAELTRARREAAGYRARLTTFEKAQADADAAKLSDLEKAQKETADLKAALALRDHADLQRAVAGEQGLPAEMANRLHGASREELTADAKALAKLIPAPAQGSGASMNPASGRGGSPTIEDYRRMGKDRIAQMSTAERAQMYTVLARG